MSHQFGLNLFATASEALEAAKTALANLKEYEATGSKTAAKNYFKSSGQEVGDEEENYYMMRNIEHAISLYTKKVEQGY